MKVEAIERNVTMVRKIYFAQKYAVKVNGRYTPPIEFGLRYFTDVYRSFFASLGDGREEETFIGSAEGLRHGNIRAHLEKGEPLNPAYEPMLVQWKKLKRHEQWNDLKKFQAS